jgi:thiol:disulfide interchange protein DsbD
LAAAQGSSSVVKVSPGASSYRVKQQGAAKLSLVLDIAEGYYLNSNRPNDRFLVAMALTFDRMPGVTLTPVVYPRARQQKFTFSEKPVAVFDGKTVLRLMAKIGGTVPTGKHIMRGKLTLQACNNQAYLPPRTVSVEIPLEVVK